MIQFRSVSSLRVSVVSRLLVGSKWFVRSLVDARNFFGGGWHYYKWRKKERERERERETVRQSEMKEGTKRKLQQLRRLQGRER